MNMHVKETLQYLEMKRQQLDQIIAGLSAWAELETNPIALPVQMTGPGEPVATAPTKRGRKVKAPRESGRRGSTALPEKTAVADRTLHRPQGLLRFEGLPTDKPTTVGGGMKWLLLTAGTSGITRAALRASLEADADWAKGLAESPTRFSSNLCFWADSGKLKRTDGATSAEDHFTVADRAWFETK